jgi:phage anti-repressor protein
MGKPFGKKPNDWLRLPATISFLETLANARKSRNSDYQPVITIRGNPDSGGGTWFHEDVAIEYAGWLSDEFKIWCNDRVQRFLNNVKKQKMNEIIKIRELSGRQIISARELHDFLEVGRDFTTWCKQMFEYGFEENKDFTPISVKSTGGRPSTDYALTLDCGKEIAMIQRTPKGWIFQSY